MTDARPAIAAMTGYVPGEQPPPGKFLKLNTNENPYPCSPAVKRAIGQVCRELGRYPDPQATAFRLRAADILGVDADWILCGNGSDDLLTIVVRTFVGEGDTIRTPYPSYILYRTLAAIQGARFEPIPFPPDWSLPTALAQPADDLKLVFLANPNSPSGTIVPRSEVSRLAAALPCPLIVDEAYVDFASDHCLELVAEHSNLLVTRSLSKSYSLAGLRFGFLVAQPAVIEQLAKVKDSYNCDTLSIAGATAAIDDQAWLRETVLKIRTTRQRLTETLRSLGFAAVESEANFVWAPHPQADCRQLYEQLKQDQILVRYMDFEQFGDGLRISVGTDEQIDACLNRLRELV